MRTTAASLAPGPAKVLVRTEVSYCSVIHRLEAIAGDASNFKKFCVRIVTSMDRRACTVVLSDIHIGAGEMVSAHVRNRVNRASVHGIEAGTKNQIRHERSANLHIRPLLLRLFGELGGRKQRRSVNP